ncbi:MAG: class II aldolase/adducin family protein [Candidatus Sumerlaeia bacterium]|nr:class II aldolase/adducin family protein [Candidatus Sumerlaeia bacterium]
MSAYGSPLDEGDLSEQRARELFCEIGRRCYAKNFVEANGGNFSYRLADGRILATPTMISKGFMEPDDMVLLDLDGNQIGGHRQKTSEILMHLTFYRHRSDVRAVVHAHPRYASAFAVTNTPVPKCVIPEVEIFVGEVPITDYETPGTPRLSEKILPVIRDFNVFLLANHGAVTLGRGVLEAFWRMEILDAYCQTILLAWQLGEITQVTDRHMKELFQLKERLGFPDRRLSDPRAARCDVPPPCATQSAGTCGAAPLPGAGVGAGGGTATGAPDVHRPAEVVLNPSPEVVEQIAREVLDRLRDRGLI